MQGRLGYNFAMGKKAALIIERADIVLGGAERSVFDTAEAISLIGYDVDILAAKGQGQASNLHILCKNEHGKRTRIGAFGKALKQHFSKNHYDIIHSFLPFDFADIYQPRGGSFPEATLRNAVSYQNAFVGWWKNTTAFVNSRRAELAGAEKKLCAKQGGPIVAALSKYVAWQFKRYYHLSNERLVIIPNGVKINTEVCKSEAERLQNLVPVRCDAEKDDKPVIFLFAANNFRLKGLKPLLKAISAANNNCILMVAGSGEISKYRNLARELGIEDRVIFAGSVGNIQNAMSVCDAAVLPTFYDPASRFILEALASGKPVITTKFNGAADLFTDGRHGKVIDKPENTAAMTEAIVYFCNRDNLRKASQAITEDKLKENISIERVGKQLESLYKKIIERKR